MTSRGGHDESRTASRHVTSRQQGRGEVAGDEGMALAIGSDDMYHAGYDAREEAA